MQEIKFKGEKVKLQGESLELFQKVPDFELTKEDLSRVTLNDFKEENIILNIFPSVDTPVCSISVKRFNKEVASKKNLLLICISKDLPFAQKRFCQLETIENALMLSDFRDGFLSYGLKMIEGPLSGLLARAVLVLNHKRELIYKEIVEELTSEPDYESILRKI